MTKVTWFPGLANQRLLHYRAIPVVPTVLIFIIIYSNDLMHSENNSLDIFTMHPPITYLIKTALSLEIFAKCRHIT